MAAAEGNEGSMKGPHVRLRGHNITPARPLSTLPAPTTTFPVTSITPGAGHQTK